VLIEAHFVARQSNAANRAGYIRRALVYREAAGAATLQGTVDSTFTRESDNGWNATITVSGNNALLRVEGDAGADVDWESTHVIYDVS
jgi:hypothetical protein